MTTGLTSSSVGLPMRDAREGVPERASTWTALLDVLEERNRRLQSALDAGELEETPEPLAPPDRPPGPDEALRAQLVLAEIQRLQQLVERRRDTARRALQYNQA